MTGPFNLSGPERRIVHFNVVNFAVAVERRNDPALKYRPVIIAPEGGSRAGVCDMSQEAFRAGVQKTMPLYQARRFCPDAVVLSPRPFLYTREMLRLVSRTLCWSPLIEHGEMDGHIFVDLTGTGRINGPAADAARQMSLEIQSELGVLPSWAVAPGKLVAKAATRTVKPYGHCLVAPGQEESFMAPLALELVPWIGSEDLARLRELNFRFAGQVAGLGPERLSEVFGRRALRIYNAVCGIDNTPVREIGQNASYIRVYSGLAGDICSVADAEAALYRLSEKIGTELRKRSQAAPRLVMAADYADGRRCFRQTAIDPPVSDDITLFEISRGLLHKAWVRRVRPAGILLTCPGPVAFQVQKELFCCARTREKRGALMGAVDCIRQRFGRDAVCMGRVMAV